MPTFPAVAAGASGPKVSDRRAEISGFVLTDQVYAPGARIPWHSHADAEFIFGLSGSLTEVFGRHTVSCARLDCIFQPASAPHQNRIAPDGARCLVVEVPARALARLPRWIDVPLGLGLGGGQLGQLGQRIYEEFRSPDELTPLVVESTMLDLLARAARLTATLDSLRGPKWLARVRELVHDCFDQRLDLSAIAEAVGVHPGYLPQAFRRRYGCSIGVYQRRLRVEAACRALAESKRRLSDIAAAYGFSDQSHFSRVLKQHTGMSPLEFRRAARPGGQTPG